MLNLLPEELAKIVITLIASAVMGLVFLKLNVPGGMLVGAIVGGAVVNLGFQVGYIPPIMKTAAQTTAGAFIGTMVGKDDIKRFKSIYKVGGIVIGSYALINLVIGYVVYLFAPYDLLTCLMCTIPGGMSDVPLIAADMGADVAPVVVVHFVRTAVGIGIFPSIITWLNRREKNCEAAGNSNSAEKKRAYDRKKVLITILLAAILGTIGKKAGIPVGAMVFSMIGIACIKLLGFDAQMPRWIKRIAQALSGAYIGCSISRSSLRGMQHIVLPTIVIIVAYITNMFITGQLLHKRFNITKKESMLMLTPAGAGDMALISQDIGVDSPVLITIHVIRLFISDAILPQVCNILTHSVLN